MYECLFGAKQPNEVELKIVCMRQTDKAARMLGSLHIYIREKHARNNECVFCWYTVYCMYAST